MTHSLAADASDDFLFILAERMGLSVDEVAATLRRKSHALEVDESGKWVRGQTRLDRRRRRRRR